MKRLLILTPFLLGAIFLKGNTFDFWQERHRIEMIEYQKTPAVRLSVLTTNPLPHTIVRNQGDTIVELITPPVGDQGSQGSCNAWAMGYGCGSIHAYSAYQDMNWAKRSPAFLFNFDNNCLDNYVYASRVGIIMRDYGVCSYYLMPYDEDDCSTSPNSSQLSDAILNTIEDYAHLNSNTNLNEYKQILLSGYPIAAGTRYLPDLQRVCNSTTLHGYWGSIVDTCTTQGGHAMCIVGFNDSIGALKVLNSWGTSQGDNGFVWVSYNLVQNGIFDQTYVFEPGESGFVPQIQGPTTLTDSAWYYVRNAPINGATITWSITNTGVTGTKKYHLVSPNGRDSMYIADRPIPLGPINPPVIGTSGNGAKPGGYHRGNITVTLNYGSNDVHTVTKTIREYIGFGSKDVPQEDNEGDYKMELWSTTYGLVRVQDVDSAEERMDMNGLPQGVYVLIIKQNGIPVSQQKVMIP